MPAARNPIQLIKEAKQIAVDHGGFVIEKNGAYLIYRKTPLRNVYEGLCKSPQALHRRVRRVFNFV